MTGLDYYKLLFVAELVIAEALFTFGMARRKLFPLRLIAALAVCFTVAYFYPTFEGSNNGWYTSLMFLALFGVTLCGILFIYRISFKKASFLAVAAYTAQHLAYEVFKLICLPFDVFIAKLMYGNEAVSISSLNLSTVIFALVLADIYLVVYAAAYFFIGKKIRNKDVELKSTSMLVSSAVILLVDIILNAFVVYVDEGYDLIYDVIVGVYNILCCLLVFYIQRKTIYEKDMRDELKIFKHLLQQAKTQFQLRKEEVNLINIKCHDLKHQISKHALRGGLDDDTVAEINDMISIYDANIKTGNKTMDIIFTERSLICNSKKITLTVMADCSELGFMGDGELYTLFGNILDNAVEATSEVADEEKRCIDVNIRSIGGFISIIAENFYNGELCRDEDGTIKTAKSDKDYHGFGLKSIELVVAKYNGNVSIDARDNIFRLSILLPKSETKAPATNV